jgi:hypothetical protein
LVAAGLAAPCARATFAPPPTVLYDDRNQPPLADQDWLRYVRLEGATPQAIATGLRLDTYGTGGAVSGQAGLFSHQVFPYFPGWSYPYNPAWPGLDPRIGFTLGFELAIEQETHASPHRAGFSVILLGADRRGVELGFWEDRIWVQDDGAAMFTQAEGVAFDTTAGEVLYSLSIAGMDYLLEADGTKLLRGRTRSYVPYSGALDPYETANLVFLGDDTNSAAARVRLGQVELRINDWIVVPVPAPPTWGLLAPALLAGAMASRRHKRDRAPSRTDRVPTST